MISMLKNVFGNPIVQTLIGGGLTIAGTILTTKASGSIMGDSMVQTINSTVTDVPELESGDIDG